MGKGKRTKKPAANPQTPAAPNKRKAPVIPLTIGVVVILIAIAVIAGGGANSVALVDGQVSRTIATVDECASTVLTLSIPPDGDTEEAAAAIFDALSKTVGVGEVTVYEENPRVQIEYCQSYTSEPELRSVLAPTGYLAP